MEEVKLLICGGPYYDNVSEFNAVIGEISSSYDVVCVIHGASHIDLMNYDSYCSEQPKYKKEIGSDYLTDCWAHSKNIKQKRWPALFHKYGRSAISKRNYNMYWNELPDLCVAFPGGKNTASIMKMCYNAGTPVLDVKRCSYLDPQKK